jgi:integrase
MEESMSRKGRPRNADGSVFPRKKSVYWWVRYRDQSGQIVKESAGTKDREEAERFLRTRLAARDDGTLPALLSGKNLSFSEWAEWFLERRSKPPYRQEKTHLQNMNAIRLLTATFGSTPLSEISPAAIEDHLWRRPNSDRCIRTKFGIRRLGKLKPSTVHQELRVLTRMLNIAVQQKRLSVNPCNSVEFPVPVSKSIRKPHYTTATEQAQIESCSPAYLRNAIVILVETGLRPFKELMPMRKDQVDLENSVIHIPDSKTPSGIGDMPMTRSLVRPLGPR